MTDVFRELVLVRGASESHVLSGGVRSVLAPGGAAVPVAVLLVAHEGAAFLHLISASLRALE